MKLAQREAKTHAGAHKFVYKIIMSDFFSISFRKESPSCAFSSLRARVRARLNLLFRCILDFGTLTTGS